MGENPAWYQSLVVSHKDRSGTLAVFDVYVSSPIFMFAYDTKIFQVMQSEEDYIALQNDLNLLLRQWQLKFNNIKCFYMVPFISMVL